MLIRRIQNNGPKEASGKVFQVWKCIFPFRTHPKVKLFNIKDLIQFHERVGATSLGYLWHFFSLII